MRSARRALQRAATRWPRSERRTTRARRLGRRKAGGPRACRRAPRRAARPAAPLSPLRSASGRPPTTSQRCTPVPAPTKSHTTLQLDFLRVQVTTFRQTRDETKQERTIASREMNASSSGANSGDKEANELLAATCCFRSMSQAPAASCISVHASFKLYSSNIFI